MKTTIYLLRQNLKFYRKRYVMFILSIIFAVLVIISIGCFNDTLKWFQQERFYYEFGRFDLSAEQTTDTLSSDSSVDSSVQVSIEKCENETQIVHVSAFNDLLPLHLIEGTYPTNDDEIAIAYHDYRVYGNVEVNQQINLDGKLYTVTGIIDDGRAYPYGYDKTYYMQGQFNGPIYNYLKLKDNSSANVVETQAALQQLSGVQIKISTPNQYKMHGSGRGIFNLAIQCIFGCIVVTMFFWVKNMYLLCFNEHRKNYQIYHALGLNQKQLTRLAIGEAFGLGLFGCLIGILASYLILSLIFMFSGQNLFGYMAGSIAVKPILKPALLILTVIAIMLPLFWTARQFVRSKKTKLVKPYQKYDNKTNAVKMLSSIYYQNEKLKIFGIQFSLCISLVLLFVSQFALNSIMDFQYRKLESIDGSILLQVFSLSDEAVIAYDDFLDTINDLIALAPEQGSYEIEAGNQFFPIGHQDILVNMKSYDVNHMAILNADHLGLNEAVLLVNSDDLFNIYRSNNQLPLTYDGSNAKIIYLQIKESIVDTAMDNPMSIIVSSQTIKAANAILAADDRLNMAKNVTMKFDAKDSYQLEKELREVLDATSFQYNLLNKVKSYEESKIQANALSYFSILILGAILITTFISFISTLMLQIENRKQHYRIYRALGMNSVQLKAMLRNEINRCLYPSYVMAILISLGVSYAATLFLFEGITLWVGFPYGLIVGLGVVLVISSQCLKIHAVSVIIKKTGIAANVE
ncbi:FtsX-like permease family protein [Dielma fastidiosa]|uniref:FtsX-like permease family protein n=1 Tax=Dielma fastidiosa TaxID=1034346 RepID=UPI0023F1EAD1|nr:ABC transporter permease [Dielma fastidiosa]